MDTKNQGSFSLGLKSIELQLQTLFSDCGGDKAIELMDALSRCNADDQASLLKGFIEAATGKAQEDTVESTFEDELYTGLMSDLDLAASAEHEPRRLFVVEGGRNNKTSQIKDVRPGLIDLAEARRLRKRG